MSPLGMEAIINNNPGAGDADEVFRALDALRTELLFIDEYRGQFEALRAANPEEAEQMLFDLRGTTDTAVQAYNELVALLLAGVGIDRGRPLPRELRITKRRT